LKEGYKDINEILREVGEEEGLNMNEMKDIWRHQKKYINQKQEEDGVYAIFIPFIGTLTLNVKQYTKEIRHRNKYYYTEFIKKVEKLKNDIRYKKYSNAHKKTIGIHKLVNYITNKFETEKNFRQYVKNPKNCWELISKYSNDKLKKKDE
jgi:hypothetical protein